MGQRPRDFHVDAPCDVELLAHRVLLSAVSDYFRGLFTGPMAEAAQRRVHIKETTADAMRAALQYMCGVFFLLIMLRN